MNPCGSRCSFRIYPMFSPSRTTVNGFSRFIPGWLSLFWTSPSDHLGASASEREISGSFSLSSWYFFLWPGIIMVDSSCAFSRKFYFCMYGAQGWIRHSRYTPAAVALRDTNTLVSLQDVVDLRLKLSISVLFAIQSLPLEDWKLLAMFTPGSLAKETFTVSPILFHLSSTQEVSISRLAKPNERFGLRDQAWKASI